jgi:hypothetical protein
MLFHCNNCCTNAPRCYVIRMLPVLLILDNEHFVLCNIHTITHCHHYVRPFMVASFCPRLHVTRYITWTCMQSDTDSTFVRIPSVYWARWLLRSSALCNQSQSFSCSRTQSPRPEMSFNFHATLIFIDVFTGNSHWFHSQRTQSSPNAPAYLVIYLLHGAESFLRN